MRAECAAPPIAVSRLGNDVLMAIDRVGAPAVAANVGRLPSRVRAR